MSQPDQPSSFDWGVPVLMRTLKFAGKLDVFRRLKRLTIAELSDKCGVPAKTMERLLTGENAPSASTLKRIEHALELDFDASDFEERE